MNMPKRINRAIELLEQDQPIYYYGGHTGHVLTREQGKADAKIWADYINMGMEHGSFNMHGLDEYMQGLIEGGPTNSGHRTPPIIVEPPVDGSSEQVVRSNAWQFRQILARGVHGILLCMAETPDAVRAFVESCRYPTSTIGEGGDSQSERGAWVRSRLRRPCGALTRHSTFAAPTPGRSTRTGSCFSASRSSRPAASTPSSRCSLSPGIGFAEMGPGDLHMSYRIPRPEGAYTDPRIIEARNRVKAACEANGVRFLEGATPENIAQQIDDGVRVVSGQRLDTAQVGRAYTKRTMPV